MSRYGAEQCELTRSPFSYDDPTSVEDVSELFEVKITVCCAGGGACGDDCFLDSYLDGKSLGNTESEPLR